MSMERRGGPGGIALLVAVLGMLLVTASAQAATGRAYVVKATASSLTPIDVDSAAIGVPIPVAANPRDVAVSPDGKRAYVIALNNEQSVTDNRLLVVDIATAGVIATLPVGRLPTRVTVSPDGTRVYVLSFDERITVIDATTNTATGQDITEYMHLLQDVVVSPDGTRLHWVETNSTSPTTPKLGAIATYTIATGATTRIELYDPGTIALNPAGTTAYVTNVKSGGFTVVDLTAAAASVPVAGNKHFPPARVAVAPDGTRLYVADGTLGAVIVYDAATNDDIATIPVTSPGPLALTPDGSRVLVLSGADDDTLTQIDTATNTVLPGAIDVGAGATGLAAAVAPKPPEPAVCPAGQTGTPPNCQTPPPGSGGQAPPSPGGPAQELPSAVADIAASAVPQPRIVRRTVRLRSGCVTSRLAVSGRGVKVTFAKRLPAGRCRITLRVSPTATGRRRDLLVRRDGRTLRLRGVIWL